MLNVVVYFFVYLFEMLISYIVFSFVSNKKRSTFFVISTGIMLYGSGVIINFVFENIVWINSAFFLISTFLFAVICFQISWKVAAIYTGLMDIVSLAFEFATIFTVSAIAGIDVVEYDSNLALLLMEAAISKTLYLTACVALMHVLRPKAYTNKIPRNFFFFPAGILFSLVSFWYISVHEELNYVNQMLLSVISIILLGSTVLLFIVYLHSMEKDGEYTQIKSENERLQMEKAHYDILEQQNRQLMLYAHDAKNHLAAIQSLNTDPRIDAYIEKLREGLGHYAGHCHSGNKILDVMINKYETECELHEIRFEYDVRSCNLNGVEDIDLVAILGNLLDNALTAAEKTEQKFMALETTTRNSYGVIVITNSCDTEPAAYGDCLVTTKEDRKLHGFGLKSVKRTLKKYQGDFYWDYDAAQRMFIMTVMLRAARRQTEAQRV